MDMSEEPFCMENYRKKRTWTCQKSHFVWKFTGKKAHGHVRRAILYGNLQEKCRTHFSSPHFVRKFTGKNAHGHCTKAILCGNFQEKCGARTCPPRSNTGPLSLTVRTPSVWPHCLGKKNVSTSAQTLCGFLSRCEMLSKPNYNTRLQGYKQKRCR